MTAVPFSHYGGVLLLCQGPGGEQSLGEVARSPLLTHRSSKSLLAGWTVLGHECYSVYPTRLVLYQGVSLGV